MILFTLSTIRAKRRVCTIMNNMSPEIILDEIKVMFVKSDNGPAGASATFVKLESYLPSLKGRKFYGLISGEGRNYLACVALTPEDKPEVWGLEVGSIPAGKYAKTKIKDWPKNLGLILSTFESLSKGSREDISRPRIEFYRSQQELILMLPVL